MIQSLIFNCKSVGGSILELVHAYHEGLAFLSASILLTHFRYDQLCKNWVPHPTFSMIKKLNTTSTHPT